MKIKKKTAMITSFVLGISMFTTTAMAEIASKSGYEQMKDAIKHSAKSYTSEVSNFTVDLTMLLKDNGKIIVSENAVNKYDVKKDARENVDTSTEGSKKSGGYYYSDKNMIISKGDDSDIYYVTEYQNPRDFGKLENPFEEKEAADVEKIVDAFVGSLKDYVVVDEKADGSKELSGSISEAQIPALANAIASYGIKKETSPNRYGNGEQIIPNMTKDIYVKEVTGKMNVDKNGLVQDFMGTGVIVGKDAEGKEHTLSLELLGKVYNVNSTVVTKPDLTGKKVEKHVEKNMGEFTKHEMYVGKYKNDIVIEKDGSFKKIGERFVDITQSNSETITGKYHEEYIKGYEDYSEKIGDLNFTAKYYGDKNRQDAEITIEGYSSKGNINIYRGEAKLYFGIPTSVDGRRWYGGEFYKVFE